MIWFAYNIHDGKESHYFETLANDAASALECIGQHVDNWQAQGKPFAYATITHENAVKICDESPLH